MADQLPPIPPNIGDIAGPPFLGIILNGYLFGILTLQYHNYCLNFPNDLRWLKGLVHLQFVLEFAQTAMTIADGFHWFVYGYGNMAKLGEFYLANIDSPIICAIIAIISQGVYCWRIYHLSKWKVPTMIIALVAFAQFVGGIGIGTVNQTLGTIANWNMRFEAFLILWSGCSAVADTFIAGAMTYLLLSSNGFARQKGSTVVTRLTRLIIETNVASALVAVAVLLTTVIEPIAPPRTSYFLCPGYVLGKLYSNSFITMLNNRHRTRDVEIRSGPGQEESAASLSHDHFSMNSARKWDNQPHHTKHLNSSSMGGIAIHQETAIRLDKSSYSTSPTTYPKRSVLDIS